MLPTMHKCDPFVKAFHEKLCDTDDGGDYRIVNFEQTCLGCMQELFPEQENTQ